MNTLAADVERHFDSVASQLRDFLTTDVPFLPQPRRLPPPPSQSTYQLAVRWMARHRGLTAAITAFLLTGSAGSLLFIRSRRPSKKRRAARSESGARVETVVLAGAVSSPVASALALDLERRGYIVYVVANSAEDEHYVRSLARVDLLPLRLSLTDPYAAQEQLARFQNMLGKEHVAFDGAAPHRLRFRGLVFVPETSSVPSGAVDEISSEDWSDALNAKVLNTIATAQLFLPVLKAHAAKILLLTPSVTPSLRLPGHSVENTVYGALDAFAATLGAELRRDGVRVARFKLGSLDVPSVTARQRRDGAPAPRLKPTPLRRLHDSVFDALAADRPARTWHIGRGSLAYGIVGAVAPPSVVGWMMGLGRRREPALEDTERSHLSITEGSATWEKVDNEE